MQDTVQDKLQAALANLRDRHALQGRLDAIVARKRLQDALVGVAVDDDVSIVHAGGDSDRAVEMRPVIAGCLAKVLTATLLGEAVQAGLVAWDDPVADRLDPGDRGRRALAGVEVRHLVDHTHGLDPAAIEGLPYRDDGRIDIEALCDALASGPALEPGKFYSYGHVGAWLGGALLECLHGSRYDVLLRERGLIDANADRDPVVQCPATGADLSLGVGQWIDFARRVIDAMAEDVAGSTAATAAGIPLPGWHPAERGIVFGWKHYGDGWLGHNGHNGEHSVLLRIHPGRRIAIVATAREANGASSLAAGVFGDLLPEFRMLRPPRLLKAHEAAAYPVRDRVGRYVQSRTVVDVSTNDEGALQLTVGDGIAGAVSAPRALRPADGGVFLSASGGDPEFMFVQFIADGDGGEVKYLWNGRQLWRREKAIAR